VRLLASLAALAAVGSPAIDGTARAAAEAAPLFRAPLFVGEPYRGEPGGHVLIAARGSVLWVAAYEGLRRYDLEQRTLARPAGTPPGRATAVVADAHDVWAAVDGQLYRSADGRTFQVAESRAWKQISYLAVDGAELWIVADGKLHRRAADGRLTAIELRPPGAFADVVAVASASRGVCWASFYWSGGADAGASAPRHTAIVRVRGTKAEVFRHPEPGQYLGPHALIAQPDGRVLVGFDEHRGTPVAERFFHRFDGTAWTPIGGWAPPWQRQPDGSSRFIPNTGAPIGWRVEAGSADGRFWIATRQRALLVVPAGPAPPPLGYPADAGDLLGVAETPLGLIVLGDRRLARWHGGRWTLLTAPDTHGVSREKTVPRSPGFYPATGLVLGAGAGDSAVAPPAPFPRRASSPSGWVDGVPVFHGRRPMWMDGLRGTMDTELTQYLPDLDAGDRVRFVGLAANDTLSADASEIPHVWLTRPRARDAGLLVSVEGVPVFRPGATPEEARVKIRPLRTVAIVASGKPFLDAAARFQRKNIAAINGAIAQSFGPELPATIGYTSFLYDAQRERLMIWTYQEEQDHSVVTELCYVFRPELPARVESLLGSVMENPR